MLSACSFLISEPRYTPKIVRIYQVADPPGIFVKWTVRCFMILKISQSQCQIHFIIDSNYTSKQL